jgi:hypothetical protein
MLRPYAGTRPHKGALRQLVDKAMPLSLSLKAASTGFAACRFFRGGEPIGLLLLQAILHCASTLQCPSCRPQGSL